MAAINAYTEQEIEEFARVELNEYQEKRTACVKVIRKWILEDADLYGNTDEEFIVKFLRNCKYDVERTKEKIKNYYTMRRNVPEWFKNRDGRSEEMKVLHKLGLFVPMDLYDKSGCQVVIAQLGGYDYKTTNINDVMKLQAMVAEAILKDNQSQVCGVVVVADMSGVKPGHLKFFTPRFLKRLLDCWQNVMPIRLKGVHFYKSPLIYDSLFKIVRFFLSEKMRQRIQFHGSSLESLHAYFPERCLPLEYGGTAGHLGEFISLTETKITQMTEHFLESEKYGFLKDVEEHQSNRMVNKYDPCESFVDLEMD